MNLIEDLLLIKITNAQIGMMKVNTHTITIHQLIQMLVLDLTITAEIPVVMKMNFGAIPLMKITNGNTATMCLTTMLTEVILL